MRLDEFIVQRRAEIFDECRRKLAGTPSGRDGAEREIDSFLSDVVTLIRDSDGAGLERAVPDVKPIPSAVQHGEARHEVGASIDELVHDYGSICEAISDTALRHGYAISVADFKLLNQALDRGIADAVEAYTRRRDRDTQQSVSEHLGTLAHELRNALHAAMLSFQALQRGTDGTHGFIAQVVERAHLRLRDLVETMLTEVRLGSGNVRRELIDVAALVDEVGEAAKLMTGFKRQTLEVEIARPVTVQGDRQLIMSAVSNLVENAIKYSRLSGTIRLRAHHSGQHVCIVVEDECGGLPDGKAEELFTPFVQKSSDRSGLGLGLFIVTRAIDAHEGNVRVENVPLRGCRFIVQLPAHGTTPAPATNGGER